MLINCTDTKFRSLIKCRFLSCTEQISPPPYRFRLIYSFIFERRVIERHSVHLITLEPKMYQVSSRGNFLISVPETVFKLEFTGISNLHHFVNNFFLLCHNSWEISSDLIIIHSSTSLPKLPKDSRKKGWKKEFHLLKVIAPTKLNSNPTELEMSSQERKFCAHTRVPHALEISKCTFKLIEVECDLAEPEKSIQF